LTSKPSPSPKKQERGKAATTQAGDPGRIGRGGMRAATQGRPYGGLG